MFVYEYNNFQYMYSSRTKFNYAVELFQNDSITNKSKAEFLADLIYNLQTQTIIRNRYDLYDMFRAYIETIKSKAEINS